MLCSLFPGQSIQEGWLADGCFNGMLACFYEWYPSRTNWTSSDLLHSVCYFLQCWCYPRDWSASCQSQAGTDPYGYDGNPRSQGHLSPTLTYIVLVAMLPLVQPRHDILQTVNWLLFTQSHKYQATNMDYLYYYVFYRDLGGPLFFHHFIPMLSSIILLEQRPTRHMH